MSTIPLPFVMPKAVGRKVRLLRWFVRLYVCLDGLSAIALVCGVAFWLSLAVDWAWEPGAVGRCLLLGLALAAAAYAALRYLLSPLSVRLSDTNLALLLERSFLQLKQSVITTVEAADRNHTLTRGNEELLQQTSRVATTALRGLKLRQIFQFGPLLWKAGLSLVLWMSIVVFAFWQADVFAFWLQRMQLSNEPWPREVELSVVGFDTSDDRKIANVAIDADFELEVNASIRNGHRAPEQVEIRYRLADGRRGRDMMVRVGEAIPGRDEAQAYRYQFKKVAADLNFDVVGGDDRLRNLQLRVVPRPQIFRMVLECQFPAYLARSPQTIPVSGRAELPAGTHAVCRIEATKPLAAIEVHDPAGQVDLPTTFHADDPTRVEFQVTAGDEDRVLLITMHDQDGIENREPYRIVLSVVPDQPPEVSVQLDGIGTAVTAQARIPLSGQVTDEYGLQATWVEYQIDKQPPVERATVNQPRGRRELADLGAFDLARSDPQTQRPLVDVKPGQQLTLSVKGRDAYNLGAPPDDQNSGHIGSSQRFMLDVVTDSELRALLERKELGLRQRFESIYDKMLATAALLERIANSQEPASQPGDLQTEAERNRLRVGGAWQNVVQLSYETLGVADGIEEIVGELVNNRVDTEDLKARLEQGIAGPLREVGGELMPQLERELQKLQQAISPDRASNSALVAAQAQADVVLDAMKRVLDRMLELESYNELVELLRGIAADQQSLQTETKQKRRAKLRSLLED